MLLRRFHRGMDFQTLERMLPLLYVPSYGHGKPGKREETNKKRRSQCLIWLLYVHVVTRFMKRSGGTSIALVKGYSTRMLRNLFTYLS